MSGVAPDAAVDAVVGVSPAGVVAAASDHLPGEAAMRAPPPSTATRPRRGRHRSAIVTGQALTVTAPAPVTFDHLDLTVFADGRHSVPTTLSLTADGGAPVTVAVPPIADDPTRENAAATVRVPLPQPMTATQLAVGIDAIRPITTIDYISERPVDLPVAVAELGVAGLTQPAPSGALAETCRSDLVTVDGAPVPVRVGGSVADATARLPLTVAPCGPPLSLGPGPHDVRTAVGRDGGIDIDRLVLDSSPATPAAPAAAPAGPAAAPPALTVTGQTRVSYDLRVDGATQPFWLVLGQSLNDGWHARVNGADLGPPTLVDGYANGWRITPATSGPFVITLEWTPQRLVWMALGISALAVIACLVLVVGDRRRVPPPPPRGTSRRGRGRPSTLVVVALATGAAVTFGVLAGPAARHRRRAGRRRRPSAPPAAPGPPGAAAGCVAGVGGGLHRGQVAALPDPGRPRLAGRLRRHGRSGVVRRRRHGDAGGRPGRPRPIALSGRKPLGYTCECSTR